MLETPYLYLYLMAASFSGPLLLSFDKKVTFYKYFIPLFKAIAIIALAFLIWDIIFTHLGYWGFNDRYLSGLSLFGLPLGEYLFFIVIPYCCVFIYEVLNQYIGRDVLKPYTASISNFLMGFSASLAVIFYDRWYTVITFSLLTAMVYYHARLRQTPWLGRFYLSYAVVFIPFFIVNGILTGMLLEEEVVWYNEAENMERRLLTIPLEDFFYGFVLILGVVSLFEHFRGKPGKAGGALAHRYCKGLFLKVYLHMLHQVCR